MILFFSAGLPSLYLSLPLSPSLSFSPRLVISLSTKILQFPSLFLCLLFIHRSFHIFHFSTVPIHVSMSPLLFSASNAYPSHYFQHDFTHPRPCPLCPLPICPALGAEPLLTPPPQCPLPHSRLGAWCGTSWESECSALNHGSAASAWLSVCLHFCMSLSLFLFLAFSLFVALCDCIFEIGALWAAVEHPLTLTEQI